MSGLNQYRELLKAHFGYADFRPHQLPLLRKIEAGHDCLGVMPTGGGKSVCFQVPALADSSGITLVITPLISLMHDQVRELQALNLPAAFISGELDLQTRQQVLRQASSGKLKLLYVSPEMFSKPDFVNQFRRHHPIARIVFDEAHCLSQWGHDFRPSYVLSAKMLDKIRSVYQQHQIKQPQVIALTASATPMVERHIAKLLSVELNQITRSSLARENLSFQWVPVRNDEQRKRELLTLVQKHKREPVLVYANSRRHVDMLQKMLLLSGVEAARYHAGLSKQERQQAQDDFLNNTAQVMIATTAFGMGVNKPDIRVVINYEAPRSIEDYYQMIGRAGRDGKLATGYLLCNPSDERTRLLKSADYSMPTSIQVLAVYNTLVALQEEMPGETLAFATPTLAKFVNMTNPQTDWSLNFLRRHGVLVSPPHAHESDGFFVRPLKQARFESVDEMRQHRIRASMAMIDYADTRECRQKTVLAYFGETLHQDCLLCDNCKKKYDKPSNEHPIATAAHNRAQLLALKERLRSMRTRLSRQLNVPPFLIASDAAIQAVAKTPPQSEDALATAFKWNPMQQQRFGAAFYSVLVSAGMAPDTDKAQDTGSAQAARD